MAEHITLRLANTLSEISRMVDEIEVFCEEHDVPDGVRLQVTLVVDELVTNAITYGYPEGERREDAVTVTISIEGEDLAMVVVDDGIAFDPLTAAAPDVDATLDDRPIGGLGIHFLRSFMREVKYFRQDGRNCLSFRKRTNDNDLQL